MLRAAGAKIETDFERFAVQGGQSYDLGGYTVPGDFSSASYLLAAAAVTGSSLSVRGLRPSKQGDSAIVSILQEMGAKISWDRSEGFSRSRDASCRGSRWTRASPPTSSPP
jgi:3-phosphoshikimate 1-carboxyvinyltransferase